MSSIELTDNDLLESMYMSMIGKATDLEDLVVTLATVNQKLYSSKPFMNCKLVPKEYKFSHHFISEILSSISGTVSREMRKRKNAEESTTSRPKKVPINNPVPYNVCGYSHFTPLSSKPDKSDSVSMKELEVEVIDLTKEELIDTPECIKNRMIDRSKRLTLSALSFRYTPEGSITDDFSVDTEEAKEIQEMMNSPIHSTPSDDEEDSDYEEPEKEEIVDLSYDKENNRWA
jgi:hypothetical protein